MEDISKKINELNSMVLEGNAMEAFEKFYHPDVVMQENQQEPTIGKDANRERERQFFDAVTEFRGAEAGKIAIGDNFSMVEWHYDYTHREWGERQYSQISVQEWKDGLIVKETFYYGN